MKLEFKDLAEFVKNNPDYVFQNYEEVFGHIYSYGRGSFNECHGTLDDDEAKAKYKQIKKLYGFMVSKSERDNGKLTGNKVCEFFFSDDYHHISLVSKDGFNAIYTRYYSHRIIHDISKPEDSLQYAGSRDLIKSVQLFTTKEEANEALKVVRRQMDLLIVDERKAYLKEQIKLHQEEIDKLKKELESL